MAVPDFQSLTLPVLREFADGLKHTTRDIWQRVAVRREFSAEDCVLGLAQFGGLL
jgi:hypothetical protein